MILLINAILRRKFKLNKRAQRALDRLPEK
jgi:hypothetical protein